MFVYYFAGETSSFRMRIKRGRKREKYSQHIHSRIVVVEGRRDKRREEEPFSIPPIRHFSSCENGKRGGREREEKKRGGKDLLGMNNRGKGKEWNSPSFVSNINSFCLFCLFSGLSFGESGTGRTKRKGDGNVCARRKELEYEAWRDLSHFCITPLEEEEEGHKLPTKTQLGASLFPTSILYEHTVHQGWIEPRVCESELSLGLEKSA